MSSICGSFGGVTVSLSPLLDAMHSRGPDARSVRVDRDRGVALGLGQLKTRSLEPDAEVLVSEDANLLMVCDGQVFNASELSDELRKRGHDVRSDQSCEVLLHLFEEQGEEGLRRADGQFALAIWDRAQDRLILARDFLGVRPLYYHAGSDGVVFASEIKGLLQHPQTPRAIDEIAISHYLTFLNVPGPCTLFAGIVKLPPGSVAICARDGRVKLKQFWSLLDNPIPETDDLACYVERVRELHSGAVQRRTPTDGPIAALVSGGNDSSANAAYMARFGARPLHTITVGLEGFEGDPKYNDLAYARQVANLIGSTHHERLLSAEEFLDTIPRTVDAMDDMVSEPSSVFLYHALRLAKDTGARVVVTGEANDELTCGHGEMIRIRERYYRKWAPFMRKPQWARAVVAALAPLLSPKRREILRRAADNDEYFWNFEIGWMESEKDDILTADTWHRVRRESAARVVARHASDFRASGHGGRDYLNYIVYVMMQDYYFGNLMLGKLDLLSSAIGVEPRCPYTEPAYAHLVYNVPAKFKQRDGIVKYFFKKAIEGVLPESIIYRPKQGFRTPVVELFRGALADWARPVLLDGGLTRAGVLRRDELEHLLATHRLGARDYSNRLWTPMVLNLWYERWIRSASASPAAPQSKVREPVTV